MNFVYIGSNEPIQSYFCNNFPRQVINASKVWIFSAKHLDGDNLGQDIRYNKLFFSVIVWPSVFFLFVDIFNGHQLIRLNYFFYKHSVFIRERLFMPSSPTFLSKVIFPPYSIFILYSIPYPTCFSFCENPNFFCCPYYLKPFPLKELLGLPMKSQ